jgi:hypothetical protein
LTKENIKRQGEAASLSLKIDVMVKSKEALLIKTMVVKKEMMEAKAREKEAKWATLLEDAKRKANIEEKRERAEEHRAIAELIVVENATMLMNPAAMDEETVSGGS